MTFYELKEAVNKLSHSRLEQPYLDDLPSGRIVIDGELSVEQLRLIIGWLMFSEDTT